MEITSLPFETSSALIREAQPQDTDEILRMVARLAAHHGDTSTLSAETLARDVFADPAWLTLLVAEAPSGLIGYAALCRHAQLQFGARGLDIHHLFTKAECRGLGIGTSLVRACISTSKALSCRFLSVGTHPGNLKAQAFYSALGFERRDCFPPRFVMRLEDRH